MRIRACFALAIATTLALSGLALGTTEAEEHRSDAWRRVDSPEQVRAYWSPERLASARPFPIPVADLRLAEAARAELKSVAPSAGSGGRRARRPSARVLPDYNNYLFDARLVRRPRARDLRQRPRGSSVLLGVELEPTARGNFDLDFTSSRLVPEDARLTWPYSAAGKLFFSDGDGDFICSGAVISARVVGTAGHCVFGDGGFFSNFLFVPAFLLGEAPFGAWTANFVQAGSAWKASETVPNAGDWGVMAMDDQVIGGSTEKIGNVTGWIGWILGKLLPNHVHILSYPGNIDRGQRMHQTTTGQSETFPPNTAVFGSDLEGGSSGGAWVQNFGVKGQGGYKGSKNKTANRVVGFNSYASDDGRDEISGASNLDQDFKQIFNQACNDAPGNCRKKGKPNSN